MAYALIANTGAISLNNTSVTTPNIDTTGADFLVGFISSASDVTPVDSKSNTLNGLTVQTGAFSGKIRLWWSRPTSVGSGHNWSYNGGGAAESPTICWAAFSGSVASPVDQQNGTSTPANPTVQPGSITPSENDCLVISAAGVYNETVGGPTVNSPFTVTNGFAGVGNQAWGGSLAYSIQTTAAAANPTWTVGAGFSIISVIASFKDTGGGGGGGRIFKLAGYGGGLAGEARGLVG